MKYVKLILLILIVSSCTSDDVLNTKEPPFILVAKEIDQYGNHIIILKESGGEYIICKSGTGRAIYNSYEVGDTIR